MAKTRDRLLQMLARIEQDIAEAQSIAAGPCDDATLTRARELLVELHESLKQIEALLQKEG